MRNDRLWFARKFSFDIPLDCGPNVCERLRGTPARVDEMLQGLGDDVVRAQPDGEWSILENIAHLEDLEELWETRIAELLRGEELLSPADLENRKTHEANHNARTVEDVTGSFRSVRGRIVKMVEPLSAADFGRTALHPRLKTPMRLIDLCVFVAEHDDHHLATASAIARRLG